MLKLLTSIVGALLIAQAIHAIPQQRPIKNVQDLIHMAEITYAEFFGYATDKYRELFEEVLTISNKDAETDPEMKTALQPLKKFVNEMHTIKEKSKDQLQILFNECTHLANKYDRGVKVDASEAEQKIAKYMNEAEAMKTKFDILMKYISSIQHFASNVGNYIKSMPEDDSMEYKKLQMWNTNWQREHNWEKKNDLMLRFFEIFDTTTNDRSRLVEMAVKNILLYLNEIVMAHKDVFEKAIKTMESDKNVDDDMKREVEIMKEFVDRAEKVHSLEGRKITMELMHLFGMVQERRKFFSRPDLSESEKRVVDILRKSGELEVEVRDVILTVELGEELLSAIEEYFQTLPKGQKDSEKILMDWHDDFMNERDYEAKAGKLVNLIENLRL